MEHPAEVVNDTLPVQPTLGGAQPAGVDLDQHRGCVDHRVDQPLALAQPVPTDLRAQVPGQHDSVNRNWPRYDGATWPHPGVG